MQLIDYICDCICKKGSYSLSNCMHLTVHCLTCEYGTNLKFGHLTLFRWFYSWEQFYINRLNTQWVATNWSWKLRNPIRPLFVDPVTFMAHCALLTPQVCTYTLFMFIETLWSLTVTYRKQNIVYLPVKLQWLSAFVYNNIVISLNYNLGTSKSHPGACMPPTLHDCFLSFKNHLTDWPAPPPML